jgi:hypothetical protein
MKKTIAIVLTVIAFFGFRGGEQQPEKKVASNPPIYIAFLWHMHQPIYWPYENIMQTQASNHYSYSVVDIHNQRIGPYTSWPKNAVQKGIDAGLAHLGAQVSFSGSLMENLNNLEAGGDGNFTNWKSSWKDIRTKTTSLGNPRLDMVGFGYFHPLMGLIDQLDIQKQIEMHKTALINNFGGTYSKGMFPPENAFSERMIPALVNEGIEWILVDNIHFDRAAANYPYSTSGNLYEPNKADQINPDPKDWVQLNNLWAPTKNSAKWGRQPHYAEYVDPATGTKSKIVVVPADRYMGNEDGRGGFGALQYESVMSQLESYNTDPNHPILIVLHHDGDNYGGGSDGYYNSNFQAFVDWLKSNPTRFVCTTIQDYLQMYPVDPTDVMHVEDGSWAGADNGDPEYKKWLGDPDATTGYSPDRNSWGVITAAKNLVLTANQIDPNNANTATAWKYLLVGESSDYWYWDNSENGIWDSHPTRAANQAITAAQQVTGTDLTPPTIFLPQRTPYNPGGTQWGINQPSDLSVWSYVFDKSGLASVTLKYRIDSVSAGNPNPADYKTYAGGTLTGAWQSVTMTGVDKVSKTDPAPLLKAKEYSAQITGLNNKLIDYYIEAVDNANNVAKSPIRHCYIGANSGSGGGGGTGTQQVAWVPAAGLTKNDTIKITVTHAGAAKLHWGVNDNGSSWTLPDSTYWPAGTVRFSPSDPSVETPFSGPDTAGTITVKIGPFNSAKQVVDRIAFVIHFNDNTWNNNSNNNYHIQIGSGGGGGTTSFVMDGVLDSTACQKLASNKGADLWIGWNGTNLYVATESAQSQGNDVFIFVSDSARALGTAPWAKAGKVAGYSAMLANESTNNYNAWASVGPSASKAGTVLEGTLNIQGQFGYIPSKLYIAVGQYGTADGGALVKQVPAGNGDGNIDANEFLTYAYTITDVKESAPVSRAASFTLSQNYPNPFNPVTVINYEIPAGGKVTLKVFDVLGHEVRTLVDGEQSMGVHYAQFDAKNIASGVYYYTLRYNDNIQTKKMVVMK